MKPFIDDLSAHGYNVLKNLDALTAATWKRCGQAADHHRPSDAYTAAELTAIGNFVDAGGSLWLLRPGGLHRQWRQLGDYHAHP